MIIDTHCHYNLDPFVSEWLTHWKKAQEFGVQKSVLIGVDAASSARAVELAEQEPDFFAAVGIHPTETDDIQKVAKLLPHKKIVAIGETGLDYFHDSDESKIAVQQKFFRTHIQLALTHHLPLIIHCRDKTERAYWDALTLLKSENFDGLFVLHCVSGPSAYVQQAVEMGAYIGIAGNVTYKNAEHIRDLVRQTPKDRLLLETDAPFLPPQDFRGQTCEPWMISKTAEFVEQHLDLSADQLAENAERVFHL